MSDTNREPARNDAYDEFIFHRLLDEVYLLMDFVSGRHDKTLNDLTDIRIPTAATSPSAAPVEPAKTIADDIIAHISTLRFPPDDYRPLNARNAAFLLLVKDRLNRMAKPAIGMTIAFTAMVVGSEREPSASRDGRRNKATRHSLAAEAYPGLIGPAKRLRWITFGAIGLLLLLTLFTVYTSGVVSYGKSLIDRVDEVNRSMVNLADAIKSIETAKDDNATAALICGEKCPPELRGISVRLCERPKLLRWRMEQAGLPLPRGDDPKDVIAVFGNPQQRQICDQLVDINRKQDFAHRALSEFENRQLYPYAIVGSAVVWGRDVLRRWRGVTVSPSGAAAGGLSSEGIAGVLSVLGNYLLPMCFTLLGAGVSILRDIYNKMRESTLAPRDTPLSFGRLALGMVAGAAIGLFFSPTQIPLPGSSGMTGSVTLSGQGLAFLAGYGVDSVFAAFDGLLRRLSRATEPPGAAPGG